MSSAAFVPPQFPVRGLMAIDVGCGGPWDRTPAPPLGAPLARVIADALECVWSRQPGVFHMGILCRSAYYPRHHRYL